MSANIQLIAGLGNPGPKYERTRHNAGFWFVDALARRHNGSFTHENKFFGDVCRINIGGQDVRLLKPDTYMNESGRSVQALASFFKIAASDILVAYDEIDLPPGHAKLKQSGGHGGHNGVRDIIHHLDPQFLRLRIGVGHPGNKAQVVNFVLGTPSRKEEDEIVSAVDRAVDAMPLLLGDGLQKATHLLHTKPTKNTDKDAQIKALRKPGKLASGKTPDEPSSTEKNTHSPKPKKSKQAPIARNETKADSDEGTSLKDQLMSLFKKK